MNGKEYLVKGSVRSLPKGQMQDFRRLFEQKDAEVGKIAQQGTPKSYVQATGAKFETCSEDSSVGDEPKIRHKSPVKLTTPKQYPNPYTNYPLPSPRKKVENTDVPNTDNKLENCVSKLPLAKFGKIASGFVLSDLPSSQVNKVIGQLESADDNGDVKEVPKVPLYPPGVSPRPRNNSRSPARRRNPASPKRSPIPPKRPQPQARNPDENNEYSCIWKGGESDKESSEHLSRKSSILQRTKMFENVNQGTPIRPKPSVRQKSQTDETSTNEATSIPKKIVPPRPPVRQRSQSGSEKETAGDTYDTNTLPKAQGRKPPPPPSKPPRTGAHDDYMKVKIEKDAGENRVKFEETEADFNQGEAQSVGVKDRLAMFDSGPYKSANQDFQKMRPKRPPPPRAKKKPRPFSIATNSISDFCGSEDSDLDDRSELKYPEDNIFYETVPSETDMLARIGDLKHWDLPRSVHQEPVTLRRSLSAECIQKAVDDEGMLHFLLYCMCTKLLLASEKSGVFILIDNLQ